MTALATHPSTDPVRIETDTTLQLGRDEALGAGVRRVAMEQLEHGAGGFFDGEEVFLDAVHEARKSVKKVRALLRLVRGELKDRVFTFEDQTMRDTGRTLASIRSATAMVGAAGLIRDIYAELLAEGTFEELITRLTRRRELVRLQSMEDPKLVVRAVRTFEKAHRRYATWPTDSDAREAYGRGIRDEYRAIAPGLNTTYARGRKEMVKAYTQPSDHSFHEWRKRVKYLRHQMEFLAPLWPDVIVGTSVTLDRLGNLLGEDHDLGEVVAYLKERPELCPNPRERSLFYALVGQRRSELQLASEVLGRRVYAEKPSSVESRFGEYWDSRKLALAASLDTLSAL